MEAELGIRVNEKGHVAGKYKKRIFVRYADDFVIMTQDFDEAVRAKDEWIPILARRGLKLSASKTKVVHLADCSCIRIRLFGVSCKGSRKVRCRLE